MNKPDKAPKKPWPTKDVMDQIYAKQLWGGTKDTLYSGEGSHAVKFVKPYVKAVTSFLNSFQEKLTICDLGCGDFNVGKQVVPYSKKYIAVDIVATLIEYNRSKFVGKNLLFKCLDIANDELPDGDCALVRQVLQHLSNQEIKKILSKITKYRYVIITEHIPSKAFTPNLDITSGQGIRLKKSSGLDILAAPFYFKAKEHKELATVLTADNKGKIVTTLYSLY